MKLILGLIAMTAFAADDGCTTAGHPHRSPTTDNILFTVQNVWALPAGTQVLGLDIYEEDDGIYVCGSDNETGGVYAWDASTGEIAGYMPLDAANSFCFGVAWDNNPVTSTFYTNDWINTNFFYTEDEGVSWATFASPSGTTNARGMDCDGTDYWTTNGAGGGLYRFQPGAGAQNLSIPEVPSNQQPSGLAVDNDNGDIIVAVTTYNDHNIWVYIWNGSSLAFFGSAACPISCSTSLGLAYSEQNDHLYWSYKDGSNVYHIVDMTIDMLSFSGNTWAGIKTSF